MTQLISAKNGIITKEMEEVARYEEIDSEVVREEIAKGRLVIPCNKNSVKKVFGVGRLLRTKINANIGSSPLKNCMNTELRKLKVAVENGAEFVMDLSTGGDLNKIREEMIKNSDVPLGTVPIYQLMVDYENRTDVGIEEFLKILEEQGEQGVDFVTIHCGIVRDCVPMLDSRIGGVVSRGGSYLIKWMKDNDKENFLYEYFDRILDVCNKYDMTLSLGDGLRPGCLADATDEAQIHELKVLGELTLRAWEKGVQVIIEGPGHVPMDQIKKNMDLQKEYCHSAPFYVLGPIVTDIAPGYDHVTSAIGGAMAAYYGASFLCYVTRAEHLRLPSVEDVKEGVVCTKIAAHSADVARGLGRKRDDELSRLRAKLDWENELKLAIDPETAIKMRKEDNPEDDVCSMCGEFCSVKRIRDLKN